MRDKFIESLTASLIHSSQASLKSQLGGDPKKLRKLNQFGDKLARGSYGGSALFAKLLAEPKNGTSKVNKKRNIKATLPIKKRTRAAGATGAVKSKRASSILKDNSKDDKLGGN